MLSQAIRQFSDVAKRSTQTENSMLSNLLLGLLIASGITSVNARHQETPVKLVSNSAVISPISAEEVRVFELQVDSGQFVQIRIDRNDLKLSLKIDGALAELPDALTAKPFVTTTHSFISTRSGSYLLEIRPAQPLKGARYFRIAFDTRRPTLQDRRGIMAERAFIKAEQLASAWSEEAFLRAIRKYEEAALIWAEISNKMLQAVALKRIGDILASLSNGQGAIAYYQKALSVSRAARDHDFEIETLNSLASALISSARSREAEKVCGAVETLIQRGAQPRLVAQNLLNRGLLHYISGDMQRAAAAYEQAHALYLSANDDWGQARALNYLGYAIQDSGEIERALDTYQQALVWFRAIEDRRGEAAVLTVIGTAYSVLGEKQKAFNLHKQALVIMRAIGDRNGEATALNGLAYAHEDLGDKKRAVELYRKALKLYHTAGNRNFECLTLGCIGKIYQDNGDRTSALKYHSQALRLSVTLGMRRIEAYELCDIGGIFADNGDSLKASRYYQRSLALSRQINDPRAQAYALNRLGAIYELSHNRPKATGCYEQALELIRAVEDCQGEALILYNLAHVERDSGNLQKSHFHIRKAIEIAESIRAKVSNQQLRTYYFASMRQHYELCIDVLMRLHKQQPDNGFDVAAFEMSEHARARILLEALKSLPAEIRQNISAALLEREETLRRKIAAAVWHMMQLSEALPMGEGTVTARAQMDSLIGQYEELQSEIREQSPAYASFTRPNAPSLRQIQEHLLGPDTILLEYALGDDHSYLWAVTKDTFTSYTLARRSEIEPSVGRLMRLVNTPRPDSGSHARPAMNPALADQQFQREVSQLSQILLGDVAHQLGEKRLLIVAEGGLQYVPFSALPEPGDEPAQVSPLILKHEIVNLASASILFEMRQLHAPRPPAPHTIAVFADPVFERDDARVMQAAAARKPNRREPALHMDYSPFSYRSSGISNSQGFSRLLSTRKEAQKIIALVPEGESMMALDFEASKAMATSLALEQYKILHFATHGVADSEHPELSCIVLSLVDERGQFQDGFLGLLDIYNLKLSADLVVLSACSTAFGKDIRGEGLISLARGFMYAGGKRVIASLWNVDTDATAELFTRFYEKLLKERLSPVAALRSAQIDLMQQKRLRSPLCWAPFIFLGEWN